MDVLDYNRQAWNSKVASQDRWTVPVNSDEIERARQGDWSIKLTCVKPVPRDWFGDLAGRDVLALASGGGQQGPILAAAGARVTVFDNSPDQLGQDSMVAERESLELETVQGDMANLEAFSDQSFDLVFHPVSNCFVPDVLPVWREAYRVLRPGGHLLAGICNPLMFMFDYPKLEKGEMVVRHKLPYSDLTSLNDEERQYFIDQGEAMSFGHTLAQQIGGQLEAGFHLVGFYEDNWEPETPDPLKDYTDNFIATRALKPE